jgi:hypothetical protein
MEHELETQVTNPTARMKHMAVFRALANLRETAGGRALLEAVERMTPEERDRFQSPKFRAETRERYARFFEQAADEEILTMARDAGFGPTFSKRGLASLIGRAARSRTARSLRESQMQGVPSGMVVAKQLRGVPLPPLNATEKAQATRALRFTGPRMFVAKELAKGGDLSGAYAVLLEGVLPAPALLLRPPPSGEAFGKKNRSEILLPSDRKHCAAPHCDKVVPNRSTYCRIHARSAIQERDTEKKGKKAMARRLRQTLDRAARAGSSDSHPFMGDTLPEEFAPTTRRRRLTP